MMIASWKLMYWRQNATLALSVAVVGGFVDEWECEVEVKLEVMVVISPCQDGEKMMMMAKWNCEMQWSANWLM